MLLLSDLIPCPRNAARICSAAPLTHLWAVSRPQANADNRIPLCKCILISKLLAIKINDLRKPKYPDVQLLAYYFSKKVPLSLMLHCFFVVADDTRRIVPCNGAGDPYGDGVLQRLCAALPHLAPCYLRLPSDQSPSYLILDPGANFNEEAVLDVKSLGVARQNSDLPLNQVDEDAAGTLAKCGRCGSISPGPQSGCSAQAGLSGAPRRIPRPSSRRYIPARCNWLRRRCRPACLMRTAPRAAARSCPG